MVVVGSRCCVGGTFRLVCHRCWWWCHTICQKFKSLIMKKKHAATINFGLPNEVERDEGEIFRVGSKFFGEVSVRLPCPSVCMVDSFRSHITVPSVRHITSLPTERGAWNARPDTPSNHTPRRKIQTPPPTPPTTPFFPFLQLVAAPLVVTLLGNSIIALLWRYALRNKLNQLTFIIIRNIHSS